MPLPPPAPRRHVHTRAIALHGYVRDDGLIDVEAHLVDTQARAGSRDDGSVRAAGEPLHDMWMRMTLNAQRDIVACDAAMEATPYQVCPGVAANFAALAGLRIEAGFIRRALERVGGTAGCTHLRELLQQVATVAFQTLYSARLISDSPSALAGRRPHLLNSCYAWDEHGDMVQSRFPEHFTPRIVVEA